MERTGIEPVTPCLQRRSRYNDLRDFRDSLALHQAAEPLG
jgi:hypothetical protein